MQRATWSRSEKWLGLTSAGLALTLAAAGWWWHYRDADPVVAPPPPAPRLPQPNAFDFYVRASNAKVSAPVPAVDPVHDTQSVPANITPQELARRYPIAAEEEWLAQNAEALHLLREGFGYRCQHPPVRSFNEPLPQMAGFRELARLLVVESHAKSERGDWPGAANSALDIIRLGNDMPRGGPLIAGLVGCAVQAIGRRPFEAIAPHLGAPAARAAARRLENIEAGRVALAEIVQQEKWLGQTSLVEVMRQPNWRQSVLPREDSDHYPALGLGDIIRILSVPKRTVMSHYTRYLDAALANSRRPYTRREKLPPPGDALTELLAPAFDRAGWNFARSAALNDLLLVSLALRAYRLEHGAYPATLSTLTPAYLQRVPADPFGEGPLHYRCAGASYELWSIGPDGKDDDGRRIENPAATSESQGRLVQPNSVGDIVAGWNR